MQWASWSDFWHMGGHAFFVWGSYGLTLVLIVAELVLLGRRRRDTVRRLTLMRRLNGNNPGGSAARMESVDETP